MADGIMHSPQVGVEDVEDILAEPDDPGILIYMFSLILGPAKSFLVSNGWYLLGIGALTIYAYKSYFASQLSVQSTPQKQSFPAIMAEGFDPDFKIRVIEHAKKYGVRTASKDMKIDSGMIDLWLSEERQIRGTPRRSAAQPRRSLPSTPASTSRHKCLQSGYASVVRDASRQEAILKLQERYKREAEAKAEKDKEKEEKKRRERLDEIARLEALRNGGPGHRLGQRNTFREEYNPLMGNGSSCNRGGPSRKPARGG